MSLACDIDCTLAFCGDGMVNAMRDEQCDTAGNSATCDDDCTVALCGDGVINPAAGESCDDGNLVAGDGMSASCNHDCTPAVCGDGVVNMARGEECDTAGASDTCDQDCTIPRCGDGVVNTAAGEACDASGVITPSCNRDCTAPACGDGYYNPGAGEQCDTAGESAICDSDCTAVSCGDGMVNATAGEECDDGGPSATCGDDCLAIVCGDARLDPGEEQDPPPGPLLSVPIDDQTCRYDFSNIQQLYCSGSCGNWGGGSGCQQADADVFCKLKTDNPDATATSFTLGSTLTAPGICCPPPTAAPGTFGCVEVGVLTSRGVTLPVSVHDTNLRSTHAAGTAIVSVVCAEP